MRSWPCRQCSARIPMGSMPGCVPGGRCSTRHSSRRCSLRRLHFCRLPRRRERPARRSTAGRMDRSQRPRRRRPSRRPKPLRSRRFRGEHRNCYRTQMIPKACPVTPRSRPLFSAASHATSRWATDSSGAPSGPLYLSRLNFCRDTSRSWQVAGPARRCCSDALWRKPRYSTFPQSSSTPTMTWRGSAIRGPKDPGALPTLTQHGLSSIAAPSRS